MPKAELSRGMMRPGSESELSPLLPIREEGEPERTDESLPAQRHDDPSTDSVMDTMSGTVGRSTSSPTATLALRNSVATSIPSSPTLPDTSPSMTAPPSHTTWMSLFLQDPSGPRRGRKFLDSESVDLNRRRRRLSSTSAHPLIGPDRSWKWIAAGNELEIDVRLQSGYRYEGTTLVDATPRSQRTTILPASWWPRRLLDWNKVDEGSVIQLIPDNKAKHGGKSLRTLIETHKHYKAIRSVLEENMPVARETTTGGPEGARVSLALTEVCNIPCKVRVKPGGTVTTQIGQTAETAEIGNGLVTIRAWTFSQNVDATATDESQTANVDQSEDSSCWTWICGRRTRQVQ